MLVTMNPMPHVGIAIRTDSTVLRIPVPANVFHFFLASLRARPESYRAKRDSKILRDDPRYRPDDQVRENALTSPSNVPLIMTRMFAVVDDIISLARMIVSAIRLMVNAIIGRWKTSRA